MKGKKIITPPKYELENILKKRGINGTVNLYATSQATIYRWIKKLDIDIATIEVDKPYIEITEIKFNEAREKGLSEFYKIADDIGVSNYELVVWYKYFRMNMR